MKAVVFAYHDMGIAGLKALKSAGYQIEAIFTHEDNPNENRWFASVADWGVVNGIPVYKPENVNSTEWIDKIRAMDPDVLFSFYYRNLLSDAILNIPKAGAYNLHGSLLPKYRGRVPVNWVIINGEKETGVTLHHMVARADAGDIVGQKSVEIALEDTAQTLFNKLLLKAEMLLHEILPLIKAGSAPRIKQDLNQGSYFGRRRPEDGRIDWQWSALQIYNLIRGVTRPYPGAFTYLQDGQKLIIWWAVPNDLTFESSDASPCGTIRNQGGSVWVKTADVWIRLIDIEIAAGRLTGTEIAEHFKTGDKLA